MEGIKPVIHNSLVKIGFKKDGNYYRKDNNRIKVYPDTELSEIFERLIKFGETQKLWEIQRVLQLNY